MSTSAIMIGTPELSVRKLVATEKLKKVSHM